MRGPGRPDWRGNVQLLITALVSLHPPPGAIPMIASVAGRYCISRQAPSPETAPYRFHTLLRRQGPPAGGPYDAGTRSGDRVASTDASILSLGHSCPPRPPPTHWPLSQHTDSSKRETARTVRGADRKDWFLVVAALGSVGVEPPRLSTCASGQGHEEGSVLSRRRASSPHLRTFEPGSFRESDWVCQRSRGPRRDQVDDDALAWVALEVEVANHVLNDARTPLVRARIDRL